MRTFFTGIKTLHEERQFTGVPVGCCTTAVTFLFLFILLTLIKASRTLGDVTVNWFVAWGIWAGTFCQTKPGLRGDRLEWVIHSC